LSCHSPELVEGATADPTPHAESLPQRKYLHRVSLLSLNLNSPLLAAEIGILVLRFGATAFRPAGDAFRPAAKGARYHKIVEHDFIAYTS